MTGKKGPRKEEHPREKRQRRDRAPPRGEGKRKAPTVTVSKKGIYIY